jgi:hypothetical protein
LVDNSVGRAGPAFLSGTLYFKPPVNLAGLAGTVNVPIKTIVGKKGVVVNGRFALFD